MPTTPPGLQARKCNERPLRSKPQLLQEVYRFEYYYRDLWGVILAWMLIMGHRLLLQPCKITFLKRLPNYRNSQNNPLERNVASEPVGHVLRDLLTSLYSLDDLSFRDASYRSSGFLRKNYRLAKDTLILGMSLLPWPSL